MKGNRSDSLRWCETEMAWILFSPVQSTMKRIPVRNSWNFWLKSYSDLMRKTGWVAHETNKRCRKQETVRQTEYKLLREPGCQWVPGEERVHWEDVSRHLPGWDRQETGSSESAQERLRNVAGKLSVMTTRGSRLRRSSVGRMELIQEAADLPAFSTRPRVTYFEAPPASYSTTPSSMPAARPPPPDATELKRSRSFTDSTRNRVRSVPTYSEQADGLLGKSYATTTNVVKLKDLSNFVSFTHQQETSTGRWSRFVKYENFNFSCRVAIADSKSQSKKCRKLSEVCASLPL